MFQDWKSFEEAISHQSWRVIMDEPKPGAWNMDADRFLLATVTRPVLRLYRWSSACLSLGRRQAQEVVELRQKLTGVCDVVVRPSGGGMLLHGLDWTYSVVLPGASRLSIGKAFQGITRWWANAFKALGAEVTIGEQGTRGQERQMMPCMERHTAGEILGPEGKLVGSAQARTKDVLLQHGSICHSRDNKLETQVFGGPLKTSALIDLGLGNCQASEFVAAFMTANSFSCYSIEDWREDELGKI